MAAQFGMKIVHWPGFQDLGNGPERRVLVTGPAPDHIPATEMWKRQNNSALRLQAFIKPFDSVWHDQVVIYLFESEPVATQEIDPVETVIIKAVPGDPAQIPRTRIWYHSAHVLVYD